MGKRYVSSESMTCSKSSVETVDSVACKPNPRDRPGVHETLSDLNVGEEGIVQIAGELQFNYNRHR